MQTDIPLKRLTAICAADLLPLLGAAGMELVRVGVLELPQTAAALDTVLWLRDGRGRVHLHLVEWQGYRDPLFLWRLMGYLSWVGLHHPERPITITPIYLRPGDDVGSSLRQGLEGELESWGIAFTCVRLWQQDAEAAVASGAVGLAVLSPLMGGATGALVERAAALVLGQGAAEPRRANLLTILGVFAEPLVGRDRFVRMIGREQLMASDLLSYLMEEKLAELEQERAREREALAAERARERDAFTAQREALAAERAALEQAVAAERATLEQAVAAERQQVRLERSFTRVVEDAVVARFPSTPVALVSAIRRIHDTEVLDRLLQAVLDAPDQQGVEQLLRDAASAAR